MARPRSRARTRAAGRSPARPPGSGANANNWKIAVAGDFPVGASITTPKSLLMGYGFEGITTVEQRKQVMGRIAAHLLR